MVKKLSFCLLAVSFLLLAACKKEGVVLVDVGLRDEPKTAKGTFKWLKGVNRGQVLTIIKEKDDEWCQVQLADGETKGWIEKRYIHKGEKKIVSFFNQTKLYDQPDENSKVNGTLPAGTKAIVIKEKNNWTQVNVKFGQDGWVKSGVFSRDTEVKSQARYEVYVSGIGKCFVEASSTLPPSGGYTFSVNKLFDGNPGTPWQEGVDGGGEGEWVEITLPEPISVSVSLINGMVKKDKAYSNMGADGDLYLLNSRVKSARVEYMEMTGEGDAQSSKVVRFDDDFRDFQDIGQFMNLTRMKLFIDSVYSGQKWQDTSIGEIKIVRAP